MEKKNFIVLFILFKLLTVTMCNADSNVERPQQIVITNKNISIDANRQSIVNTGFRSKDLHTSGQIKIINTQKNIDITAEEANIDTGVSLLRTAELENTTIENTIENVTVKAQKNAKAMIGVYMENITTKNKALFKNIYHDSKITLGEGAKYEVGIYAFNTVFDSYEAIVTGGGSDINIKENSKFYGGLNIDNSNLTDVNIIKTDTHQLNIGENITVTSELAVKNSNIFRSDINKNLNQDLNTEIFSTQKNFEIGNLAVVDTNNDSLDIAHDVNFTKDYIERDFFNNGSKEFSYGNIYIGRQKSYTNDEGMANLTINSPTVKDIKMSVNSSQRSLDADYEMNMANFTGGKPDATGTRHFYFNRNARRSQNNSSYGNITIDDTSTTAVHYIME